MTKLEKIGFLIVPLTLLAFAMLMVMTPAPKSELTTNALKPDYRENQQYLAKMSAYSHTGNKTKSGIMPYEGSVAINFESKIVKNMDLHIGDWIWVEELADQYPQGLKIEDRLPSKWGRDFDLFMSNSDKAMAWGVRIITVEKLYK